MSLMDIMRGFASGVLPQQQNPTPPQNPNQPPNPNLQVPPTAAPGGNPTVPATVVPGQVTPPNPTPGIPAPAEGTKSPLDNFSALWDAPKEPITPTPLAPSMAIDPAKLTELSKNLDFSKAVNPETLTNASKGDPAALMEAINATGQAGFAHAIGATSKLIENALERQAINFRDKVLPEALRAAAITTAVREDNNLFNHPAVAPVVTMLEGQLTTKFPTATAAQIREHAENWFNELTNAAVAQRGGTVTMPTVTQPGSARKRDDTDFSGWV